MVCFVVLCQKYYHGESIAINVLVDNNTNKSVKKIKISGEFKHVVLKYCLWLLIRTLQVIAGCGTITAILTAIFQVNSC